jgi:hypothetical protein
MTNQKNIGSKISIMVIMIVVVGVLSFSACTANRRTKHFGGTIKLKLQANRKLVNVTWKDDSLWYLTRAMKEGEVAETYEFKEESSYGAFEGTVIISETK